MNGIIIFLGILLILVVGKSVFIPLIVAAFLWYLTNSISAYYRRVMPFGKKFCDASGTMCLIFDWTAFSAAIATLLGLLYIFVVQIKPMFRAISAQLPTIQNNLFSLSTYISDTLNININPSVLPDLAGLAANVGMSIGGAVLSFGMILIYLLFMFIEQSSFRNKIAAIFPDTKKFRKWSYILNSINTNMKKYLFMKTSVSVATALLSYFWLKYLGLEFAGVWAFVVFIMNYIPTFGAIISTAMPILYAVATIPGLQMPILILIGLVLIQILLSNIIEPKLTGDTLNLSTLAILINLVFWGMIWGAAGMFFSVPLLVATFVITAQFDRTRWIAVLLSADGKIPDKEE
ncbi:MAG: AI-2E family transporter [Rickettsiales bacterium]|jgi:predicted PurR-regulated permease PerM|nr:AI-2E family transporter [Rickettsiales bacterium]